MNERELFDAYRKRPTQDGLLDVLRASQDTVYNLCFHVLRQAQDAEDASQKVFLRILDVLPRIADGEHYRRLLSRASLQVALNTIESRKTRKAHEMNKAEGTARSGREIPDDTSSLLLAHIATLEDNLRCLVVDHYFEGKPMEAMASERGCSRVAIWKALEKAKERLRLSLSGAGLTALALGMQSSLEAVVFAPAPRNLLGKAIVAKAAAIAAAGTPAAAGWAGWIMAGIQSKSGIILVGLSTAVLLAGALGILLSPTAEAPKPAAAVRQSKSPARAEARPSSETSTASARAQSAPETAASPKPAKVSRPYPFSLPRPTWNPAVQAAWTSLKNPISVDQVNVPLVQLLKGIAQQAGLGLRLDPELKMPESAVTYKVKDLSIDSALRLLLSARALAYALQEDGTLFISTQEKAVSPYSQEMRETDEVLRNLSQAQYREEHGDGQADSERTAALLGSRKVSPPQGEWKISDTLQALARSANLFILNDSAEGRWPQVLKLTDLKVLNVVEERPLSEHLKGLLSASGLDFAINEYGQIVVSTPEGAEAIRRQEAARADERRTREGRLDQPLGFAGDCSVGDLSDAVEKATGFRLFTSRELWERPVTATLPAGATVRESLNRLKEAGFWWGLDQSGLYLGSKP